MPIFSLPESTLRAITSTLVLNNAVSVVKELVDNALDARATTIAIEISANTLDLIQVKDNGFGIGVEDRQLVCKRGCTSKITTIEDLEQLGGSSLGFRGEALASVADLSESVTLTTRVDGEIAGSSLKYGPAGALLSCSSASHPVGSTIRVKNFLKIIPVRRQTAVKNATKTLSAIKKLLQNYAFARGTVRFSLKVLKSKNEKANWSYSPVDSAGDLKNVASRIIGKDVANWCEIRTKDHCAGGKEGDKYSAIALLVNVNTDAAKLNITGHYISLDGRPMTAARGTIKEVVKLYRHYIRNGATIIQDLPAFFDPLIVMHISCPHGSYDVNVEPAKDEVMFVNPESILSLVKSLFKDCYGEPRHPGSSTNPLHKANSTPAANSSFNLLLAKRPSSSIEPTFEPAKQLLESRSYALSSQLDDKAPASNGQPHLQIGRLTSPVIRFRNSLESTGENRTADIVPPRARSTMYELDEDDEMLPLSAGLDDVACDTRGMGDVAARNPWSLAKLNTPVRCPNDLDESSPFPTQHCTTSTSPQLDEILLHTTPRVGTHRQPLGLRPQMPSPATSPRSPDMFQNPGPPKRPWPSRQQKEQLSGPESAPEKPATPSTEGRHGVANPLGTELPRFKRVSEIYDKDGRFETAQDSDSQKPARIQTSLDMASHAHSQRTAPLGRQFKSPLLRSPTCANRGACSPPAAKVISHSQQTLFKLSQPQNPELDEIMEFEYRKKAAHAQQRKASSKVKGRSMSIAESAQLQQSTMQTDDDVGARMVAGRWDDRNGLESQASAVASFGDRFGDHTADVDKTTKPNPHKYRYLAAATRLAKSQTDDFDGEFHASNPSGLTEAMDDDHDIPKITEDDARACLIRHRLQTVNADAGGLSRTDLKIRRTKTQRLPLEAIPPDMTLHDIIARIDFDVQVQTRAGTGNDKYTTSGKNEFITWSSSMADVLTWQDKVTTLIESVYRAKVGDDMISPKVGLDLRRMIKTHCDNI